MGGERTEPGMVRYSKIHVEALSVVQGRALAWCVQGPGFHSQHNNNKIKTGQRIVCFDEPQKPFPAHPVQHGLAFRPRPTTQLCPKLEPLDVPKTTKATPPASASDRLVGCLHSGTSDGV